MTPADTGPEDGHERVGAMRHEDAILILGDRARDELDPATSGAVDAHLAVCPSCRGWLDAYRFMARRRAETHPTPAELTSLATGPDDLEPELRTRLEDHVGRCAECAAMVALSSAGAPGKTPRSRDRRRGSRLVFRLAAVAGLLLVGAAFGIVGSRVVQPPQGGPVDILPLGPSPHGESRPSVTADPRRRTVLLALRIPPATDTPVTVRVRRGGELSEWNLSLDAASVRSRLDAVGALVVEVPATVKVTGDWTAEVTRADGATLLERTFTVAWPS